MTRKLTQIKSNNRIFNFLGLPGNNFFKFEIINMYGSNIERIYKEKTGTNVYGISHFIEHLGFKRPKDYTTTELMKTIRENGNFNASTDYDRINYWYETTMDKVDLGINLVANYALNTLDNIPNDEFETERDVVINEIKQYADNPQRMFWLNTKKALRELNDEDNVLGVPEVIKDFNITDCITIKDIFLQNEDVIYNITYDPEIMNIEKIKDKIENELKRHSPLCITSPVSTEEYRSYVFTPKNKHYKINNESEQSMTYLCLDVVTDKITTQACNLYLSKYANKTSLNHLIREKNGLTYGIHFGVDRISYENYSYFGCDVSKGNEDKLMKLFKESINSSIDDWCEDTYDKYMKSKKLKRVMNLLNQRSYNYWINIAIWDKLAFKNLSTILFKDVNKAYDTADDVYLTYEKMTTYFKKLKEVVNSEEYGKVTNY